MTGVDSLTIGLRLIRRRRFADRCMLDTLYELARKPNGRLDRTALQESVAAMFPTATVLQITRALNFGAEELERRAAARSTGIPAERPLAA